MTTHQIEEPMPQSQKSIFGRSILLFLLGMIGVVALIYTIEFPAEILEEVPFEESTLRLISMIQSGVMLFIAVLIGAATAHRVGLKSFIVHSSTHSRQGAHSPFIGVFLYAMLGFVFGVVVFFFDAMLMQNIPSLKALAARPELASTPEFSLITRFLYGGITEEILLRWGLMSLVAFILFAATKNKKISISLAIIISAILFGVGHLPALIQLLGDVPLAMTLRTIGINAALGIFYGIAYARTNLESGMIAHAATHVGLLIVPSLGIMSAAGI